MLDKDSFKALKIDTKNNLYWRNWDFPKDTNVPWEKIKKEGFIFSKDHAGLKNTNNTLLEYYFNNKKIKYNYIKNKFSILSLNCHFWKSIDSVTEEQENIINFINVVKILKPSIICLQENYTGYKFDLNKYFKKIGYFNFIHGPRNSGLSIYSKYKITENNFNLLSKPFFKWDQLRGLLYAKINGINVYNTHLSIGQRFRNFLKKQQEEIIKRNIKIRNDEIINIKKNINLEKDFILTGDFNEVIDNINHINKFHIEPFNDVYSTPFDTNIDHVFSNIKNIKVKNIPYAYSDHNIVFSYV